MCAKKPTKNHLNYYIGNTKQSGGTTVEFGARKV